MKVSLDEIKKPIETELENFELLFRQSMKSQSVTGLMRSRVRSRSEIQPGAACCQLRVERRRYSASAAALVASSECMSGHWPSPAGVSN